MSPFPEPILTLGAFVLTDTAVSSVVLAALLVIVGAVLVRWERTRMSMEIVYDFLESAVTDLTVEDVRPLVPLILTLWLFIGAANLIGLVPGLMSPTRDLAVTAALALVSFAAGHIYALRTHGISYLKTYIEPNPILLPFNVIGEVSRTLALALRLFGNMISGTLIGAIAVYLAGLLVPVPLMVLSLLTGVVQAYIFGVLTLVFAASSVATASRSARQKQPPPSPTPPSSSSPSSPPEVPSSAGATS